MAIHAKLYPAFIDFYGEPNNGKHKITMEAIKQNMSLRYI